MNYDRIVQLLVIGDSSVGKTSLITRYTNGTFKEEYLATVGLDYYSKNEEINNQAIQIKLWDTAGQERFKALTQNYFRNAEGVLLAFDVTNEESFNNLKEWISSIKVNMEAKNIFLPLIIVGNKIDMENERDITKEDAENFASENKYKYFETSAKTGEGVDEAVKELINLVLNQNQVDEQKIEARKSVPLKDNNQKEEKKKGCC